MEKMKEETGTYAKRKRNLNGWIQCYQNTLKQSLLNALENFKTEDWTMSINNATPKDWDRLRKKHPALEVPTPTIDESLMKVYLDAAQEEINKEVKETEWWKNHIANLESLERRELADFNNSWDTAQEEKEMSKEELESQIFYEEEEDAVNNPSHYNTGNIECIDAIEDSMSPAAFKGYLKGNCMKYLWRYDYKGKPVEDLKKASWYLSRLIEMVEQQENSYE